MSPSFIRASVLLRIEYTQRLLRATARCGLTLAPIALLSGCMSISLWGGDEGPATTGSIAAPVEVLEPIPPKLAYSDVAKIGQAAEAVFRQAEGAQEADWVNAATGSSGTLVREGGGSATEGCRAFDTVVTSVGGVHRYSGKLCQRAEGRPSIELNAAGEPPRG